MKKKTTFLFCFLLILLALLFFTSLYTGKIKISFIDVINNIFYPNLESLEGKIIFLHRMPKSIVALLTGIALPTSGFLLQELFKNPLAGPSILGISAASALGVAIFVFLGVSFLPSSFIYSSWMIISFAFFGAILATFLLLLFSLRIRNPNTLIIIGFTLSAFSGAMISFLEYTASADKIKEYLFWSFGSFSSIDWVQITIFTFCILIGLFVLLFFIKDLSFYMLGDSYAKSLGINIKQLRLVLLLISSFLTAVSISFTGPILFIGTIIPFISKLIINTTNYKILLLFNSLIGMIFTISISILVDLLPFKNIPINVIGSLIGGPIIIYVVLNQTKFRLENQ